MEKMDDGYDGDYDDLDLIECPGCGELIGGYEYVCPLCGHDTTRDSNAIEEYTQQDIYEQFSPRLELINT